MDKLSRVLSGNEPCDEETSIITQVMDESTLSWSTRIKGFVMCFMVGKICSFLGPLTLFLNKGLTIYVVFYTIGNVVSLTSTCFPMGPVNQLKKMFASTRIIATLVVLVSLGLTLYAAVGLNNAGLALLFVIIQYLAMTWYSLSYIICMYAVKKTIVSWIV